MSAKATDPKRMPRIAHGWAWANYGIVHGFERTRKSAVMECEKLTGKPWADCRDFMEVWKCSIVPRSE